MGKIKNLINIDTINVTERETIKKFREFQDIFHLERDHLTANNSY